MSGLTFLWAARVSSLVIVGDLLWCIVFYRDLSNSANGVVIETFWCVFRVSLLLFFLLFLFHFPSQFTRDIEKTKKKKIKRLWRYIEAFMTTLLVLLERSRWAESNDTKKVHQRQLEWATQTVQKQVCFDTFGQLVWPTPFIIDNLYWFH